MIASVALGLLCMEAGLRWFEESLSLDVAHIHQIPAIVEPIRDLAPETASVLFMGNSLTRHGIKPELLSRNWRGSYWIGLIYPDATALSDWYFVYRRYLADQQIRPDLLVLVTGPKHLRNRPYDPVKMGAFWVGDGDFRDVLTQRLRTIEERSVFLLSRWFTAFANRGRIAPRVYTVLFPSYQEALQRLNTAGALGGRGVEAKADYSLFESWLKDLKSSGTNLLVIAVPHEELYALDPELLALSEKYAFPILDMQAAEIYSPSLFSDGYHLSEEGGAILSERLGTVFPLPRQWKAAGMNDFKQALERHHP